MPTIQFPSTETAGGTFPKDQRPSTAGNGLCITPIGLEDDVPFQRAVFVWIFNEQARGAKLSLGMFSPSQDDYTFNFW